MDSNKTQRDSYFIDTIYRPPSSGVEFWELLNRNLVYVIDKSDNVIIVGDINEDQLNVHNRRLKDIMTMNYMKNVITTSTKISDNTSTLLDQILVNKNQNHYEK